MSSSIVRSEETRSNRLEGGPRSSECHERGWKRLENALEGESYSETSSATVKLSSLFMMNSCKRLVRSLPSKDGLQCTDCLGSTRLFDTHDISASLRT